MKSKYISILWFILLVSGVVLIGFTPARADSWNRTCTGTPLGECVQVPNSAPEYTIKAFFGFDENGDEIPVQLGVNWPIQDPANGRTIFRYITGPTVPGNNISGQSYTVFDWPVIPSGGDPSGAQASLDTVWDDCNARISPNRIAWKLNRVANKNKDGIIDIYMPLGTGYDNACGHVYIKWGGICDGGQIWVAATEVPVQGTAIFNNCGSTTVTVTFDQCTGLPTNVDCTTGGTTQSAKLESGAQLCYGDDPTVTTDCFEINPNTSGAMICTSPPIFTYGDAMWFCPQP